LDLRHRSGPPFEPILRTVNGREPTEELSGAPLDVGDGPETSGSSRPSVALKPVALATGSSPLTAYLRQLPASSRAASTPNQGLVLIFGVLGWTAAHSRFSSRRAVHGGGASVSSVRMRARDFSHAKTGW
jgi:hypothetical protein